MELILIDEGFGFDVEHPIHIHGYSPYLVAYERHTKNPKVIFSGPGSGMMFLSSLYTKAPNIIFNV